MQDTLCLLLVLGAGAFTPPAKNPGVEQKLSRRWCARLAGSILLPISGSFAFDNSLPVPEIERNGYRKKGEPRTPGAEPRVIGLQKGSVKLYPCLDGRPHCFSTTSFLQDDDMYEGGMTEADPYYVPAWTFDKPREAAMQDLVKVVLTYPPGQAGIDGGGWKIIQSTPKYLYVQYESLKRGFRDDVEFAVVNDGVLQMRSSSRLGYVDRGVNAKRLNYFAQELGSLPGWYTQPITQKNHWVYFAENNEGKMDNQMTQILPE